jgi:quinol monooxygenase YgiN
MTLMLTDDFSAENPVSDTRSIPKTGSTAVVRIWKITGENGDMDDLREMAYKLLPVYWKSDGIIDCKIMEARNGSAVLIIESWQNPIAQQAFYLQPAWKKAMQEFSSAPRIRIEELANEIFELIE